LEFILITDFGLK